MSSFSRASQGFPPVRVQDDEEIFTSLGNGHFFQAGKPGNRLLFYKTEELEERLRP